MHGDGRGVLAEALVSWLSLYGVFIALRVYWKQTARSRLERCAMFLLECLGLLLAVRGIFWITDAKLFGILTYVVAAVLPLAILLYVESLLRRHFALAAKIFVIAGTALFLVLALWGNLHAHRLWLPVFTGYVFTMQLMLSGAIVFRDRADLAPVEERSVAAIAVAVVMIVPFVATDLATDVGLRMVRVGSVGILMFVHAIVVASEPRGNARWLLIANLAVIAIAALLGALQAYVIGDLRDATIARSASMFACIILLVMIHTQVYAHGQIGRGPGLVRSIATADTSTTESFLRVLERLPMVADYRLMRAPDLGAYDLGSFPNVFRVHGDKVVGHNQLRRRPQAGAGDAVYHAEQLQDLLQREDMTHAVLIRESPVALLLVQIPAAGMEQAAIAQLGLIRSVAEVIERGSGDARAQGA
jgi:hypothetical protein